MFFWDKLSVLSWCQFQLDDIWKSLNNNPGRKVQNKSAKVINISGQESGNKIKLWEGRLGQVRTSQEVCKLKRKSRQVESERQVVRMVQVIKIPNWTFFGKYIWQYNFNQTCYLATPGIVSPSLNWAWQSSAPACLCIYWPWYEHNNRFFQLSLYQQPCRV